jgi:hypothetical protein
MEIRHEGKETAIIETLALVSKVIGGINPDALWYHEIE